MFGRRVTDVPFGHDTRYDRSAPPADRTAAVARATTRAGRSTSRNFRRRRRRRDPLAALSSRSAVAHRQSAHETARRCARFRRRDVYACDDDDDDDDEITVVTVPTCTYNSAFQMAATEWITAIDKRYAARHIVVTTLSRRPTQRRLTERDRIFLIFICF